MHSLIFSQTLSAERLTRNKERPPQRSENAASTESPGPLRILFASEWKTTDTCIDTWSTLGYHDYMGVMWYRATTDIPARPAGKKLYLNELGTGGILGSPVVLYRDN